jgi:hypothetical protein
MNRATSSATFGAVQQIDNWLESITYNVERYANVNLLTDDAGARLWQGRQTQCGLPGQRGGAGDSFGGTAR